MDVPRISTTSPGSVDARYSTFSERSAGRNRKEFPHLLHRPAAEELHTEGGGSVGEFIAVLLHTNGGLGRKGNRSFGSPVLKPLDVRDHSS